VLTLVIYDISSDDVRTKLSNRLFDYGLQRIQYSAFKGELNTHDREVLTNELLKFAEGGRDSIYVLPLCERCARLCRIIFQKSASPLAEGGKVRIV